MWVQLGLAIVLLLSQLLDCFPVLLVRMTVPVRIAQHVLDPVKILQCCLFFTVSALSLLIVTLANEPGLDYMSS